MNFKAYNYTTILITTLLVIAVQCSSHKEHSGNRSPSSAARSPTLERGGSFGIPDLNRSPSPNSRSHGAISPFRGHHQRSPSVVSVSSDSRSSHSSSPRGGTPSVTSGSHASSHAPRSPRLRREWSSSSGESRSRSESPESKGKRIIIDRTPPPKISKRRKKDGSGPSGTAGIDHPATPSHSIHESDFYVASSHAPSTSSSSMFTEMMKGEDKAARHKLRLGGPQSSSSSSGSSLYQLSDIPTGYKYVPSKSESPRESARRYSPSLFRSHSLPAEW